MYLLYNKEKRLKKKIEKKSSAKKRSRNARPWGSLRSNSADVSLMFDCCSSFSLFVNWSFLFEVKDCYMYFYTVFFG